MDRAHACMEADGEAVHGAEATLHVVLCCVMLHSGGGVENGGGGSGEVDSGGGSMVLVDSVVLTMDDSVCRVDV